MREAGGRFYRWCGRQYHRSYDAAFMKAAPCHEKVNPTDLVFTCYAP